jgi:ABC-type amino acid transport substrate-binding protein
MSKFKEILKEKSTWAIGVPSIIVGAMSILDADNAQEVASAVTNAGETYVNTGDWKQSLGWLAAGIFGIFMRGR